MKEPYISLIETVIVLTVIVYISMLTTHGGNITWIQSQICLNMTNICLIYEQ